MEHRLEETQDSHMEFEDSTSAALFDEPLEVPLGVKRMKRLPKKFQDHLPSSSNAAVLPISSLPHLLDYTPTASPSPQVYPAPIPSRNQGPTRELYVISPNNFELFRVYPDKPFDNPDARLQLEDFCDSGRKTTYAPFRSFSSYLLTAWANREVKEKTNEEIDELVHRVLLHPDFKLDELRDHCAQRENSRLDGCESLSFDSQDGWQEKSVRIKLPAEDRKKRTRGEEITPEFEITGIHHRSIMDVIYKALDDPGSPPLHYTPYKEYWKPTASSTQERIYSELYSSDSWLEAHEEVRAKHKDDAIEACVLPIILYSDSTYLSSFGNASLWPIYMYLGSHSKYMRSKPTLPTCHHLAYIPTVVLLHHKHDALI